MTYTEPLGDTWKYDPEYHRVADFLGVSKYERDSLNIAQKISFLVDQVQKSIKKKGDIVEILARLETLKKDSGLQARGKTLVDELYLKSRLKEDTQRFEDEKAVAMKLKREEEGISDEEPDRAQQGEKLRKKAVSASQEAQALMQKIQKQYEEV